jgi:Flagellar basal body rod protein
MSGMTSLVQAAGVIEQKMETVANNLANVNTVGFKEDQTSFREVLSTVQRVVPESLEERFLSHEYLDDYVGMDKSAVIVDEVGKNFELGRMRSTGNDLNFENCK